MKDAVAITSNRDEHIGRANAAAPGYQLLPDKKIIFPRDAKAGGTWFAAGDDGMVAVLLNGAFVKHMANPPYRKSRGLIVLEMMGADDPGLFFAELDLENIEPFTIILYRPGSLYELRWDGHKKFEQDLDPSGNYIWSSSTLYSDEVIGQRKKIFDRFVDAEKNMTVEQVYAFHAHDHGDDENGFVINRQTGMKTFSITQAVLKPGTIRFLHTDLLQHQQFEENMRLNPVPIK